MDSFIQSIQVTTYQSLEMIDNLFSGRVTFTLTSMRHTFFTNTLVCEKINLRLFKEYTTFFFFKLQYLTCWLSVYGLDRCFKWYKCFILGMEMGALVDPYTDREKAAPCELLKVYRFKCSTGCKNSWCGSKGYALPCTSACGSCKT